MQTTKVAYLKDGKLVLKTRLTKDQIDHLNFMTEITDLMKKGWVKVEHIPGRGWVYTATEAGKKAARS